VSAAALITRATARTRTITPSVSSGIGSEKTIAVQGASALGY
jgi:hypothetical protein